MKKTHKITFILRIVLLLQFILISIAHAALENGVPFHTWVDGKTLANTTIIVPDEATKLIVSISDGSGNLDLYLKYGSPVSGDTISAIDADADIRSDGVTADETIILTPSTTPGLRAGTWHVATLNLNDDKTTLTLTATIEVESPTVIEITDNSVNFGSVVVGQTVQKSIQITNDGTSDLVISSVGIKGGDAAMFQAAHDCTTIYPSEACVINFTFSPTSSGVSSTQLNIYSNDPDTPTLAISLTGTGVEDVAEELLPLPTGQEFYPTYPPVILSETGIDPSKGKPVGVGNVAQNGDTVSIEVKVEKPAGPYDAYFALHAPSVDPDEFFMLGQDGAFHSFSQVGLVPWKQSISESINEKPFGDFPISLLPGGIYNFYFLLTTAGSLDEYYLWHSYFSAPGTPENVPDGSAGFFNGSLVVPNATIIYQGELHEGSAPLAEDGIAAITKDGKTYLYHPAMGQAELSDYNSRRAVGYFMAGVSASEVAAMRTQRTVSSRSDTPSQSATTTAAKVIGVGKTVRLGTGVDITLLDSTGWTKAVNKGRRFVVVKTGESKSKKYFMVPRSNVIPTELMDQLMLPGQVIIEGLDGAISNLNSERYDIETLDKIETFGAFVRMAPVFAFKGGWGKNQLESYKKDKDLTALVNSVDLYYSTLEFFKNITGLFPLECVDTFLSSGLFRFLQSNMVLYMTEDLDAKFELDMAALKSMVSSLIGCGGTLVSVGAGEAFNSFFDIISLFNWVIEDVIFENFLAFTGGYLDAYDLAVVNTKIVAYQYRDESSGDTAQVWVMAGGKSWHVVGGPKEYCTPKALSQNGVLVISCIDKEGDNDRLISVTDWGRGAQTNLPEACNVSNWYESSGAKVDVDDSGRVYFQAEKAWYDTSNERIRNYGIYTVNTDGSDCRYIPIDIPPTDTKGYDRIDADSLAVTGDGQRVVFSDWQATSGNVLVSAHPGGVYIKMIFSSQDRIHVEDVSQFESGKVIFRYRPDPASSLFELGVMPIKGGASINLSEVTGVTTILNSQTRNSCISPDGGWIGVRAINATRTQNLLIVKSDGSEWRWLDTGTVAWYWDRCRFSPDGKSIIFSGYNASITKKDIYSVKLDLKSPDITNLTNTDDVNETKPEI